MLAATAAQHQFVPLLSVHCILKFVSLLGIYDHAISGSGFLLNEHRLRNRLCLFRGNSFSPDRATCYLTLFLAVASYLLLSKAPFADS
jgi:hypothetical protein